MSKISRRGFIKLGSVVIGALALPIPKAPYKPNFLYEATKEKILEGGILTSGRWATVWATLHSSGEGYEKQATVDDDGAVTVTFPAIASGSKPIRGELHADLLGDGSRILIALHDVGEEGWPVYPNGGDITFQYDMNDVVIT
jgi:hypothetical protein